MGINGGRGIRSIGAVLGSSGISLSGGGTPAFSFGNALQFDGVNDYVSFTSIDLLNNSNYSINAWVKTSDTTADTINRVAAPIVGDNEANQLIAFGVDNGKAVYQYFNGVWNKEFSTTTVADGNWHMITWVHYSDQTLDIYVDSVKEVNGVSVTSVFNGNVLALGASFARVLDGVLDETFILTGTAITQTNVTDLYKSGNGALASDIITPTAYWRFNENDGDTTLIDETGNYNGTLNNFSTPPAYFIPH